MANISHEDAIALVNQGGWKTPGDRQIKKVKMNAFITKMEVSDGHVVALNDSLAVASIATDRLSIDVTGTARPRQMVFCGPFCVKQQRKKIEGGGWDEVECFGTLMRLVHVEAQAQYEKELAEKRRLDEQAKREEQRLAREQQDAECSRRLAEYIARQRDRLRGACFESLCIRGDSVTVKFSGGLELTVELHDREDPCDVRTEASLGIVIGGEYL